MNSKPWKLNQTKQCKKCPWLKSTNPLEIPYGYDIEKHKALASTIADKDNPLNFDSDVLRLMACHETDSEPCIGWLMSQLHDGNNIALRLKVMSCENINQVELIGEQHETFNDTLPEGAK